MTYVGEEVLRFFRSERTKWMTMKLPTRPVREKKTVMKVAVILPGHGVDGIDQLPLIRFEEEFIFLN